MSSTKKARKQDEQPQEVSATELAKRLKIDPRDLRKWLRSEGMGLGERGKRYAFTPEQAAEVSRKWKAAQKKAEAADES